MRYLQLLVMGGIVLALAGSVGAVGIPFSQPYHGPVYWHLSNWDEGRIYTGFLADGVTPVQAGQTYTPTQLQSFGPSGGMHEDSWGIFRVESIYTAAVDNSQTDTIVIGSTQLYDFGAPTQTTEILGIFHGRLDDFITFVDMTPLNPNDPLTQVTQSHGDRFDLYTQPKGSADAIGLWDNGILGPSARLAAGVYPGVGFDAAGNPLPGSDLALTGHAQAGFQTDEVITVFTPTPSGNSGSGTFGLFISWDGGSQLNMWDTNVFPIGYSLGGISADLRLQGTATPTGLPTGDPWLVHTSDPATTAFIPEPVTMAGLLLGFGCLGGYFRKRR